MDYLIDLQKKVFSNVPTLEPLDIDGFMLNIFQILFESAVDSSLEQNPDKSTERIIIEVGTYKGLSANTMASICKQKLEDVKIICVDTWLGSPEHIESLERTPEGVPLLYDTFLKNTKSHSNDDVIYPFPMSSTQAAHFFINKGVTSDIIYIDAGHEYEAVLLDIKLFWQLLKPGGTMIFDDYGWSGVKRAVDEFLSDSENSIGSVNFMGYQLAVSKTLPGQSSIVIETRGESVVTTQSVFKYYIPEEGILGKLGPVMFV